MSSDFSSYDNQYGGVEQSPHALKGSARSVVVVLRGRRSNNMAAHAK